MKRESKKRYAVAAVLLAAFAVWTAAVCTVDVQPVGPEGAQVGFAALNGWFHALTGVHLSLYVITDWLSLIPLGIAVGFALLGLVQWIQRKHILRVDRSILVLGGFYAAVMAVYQVFEMIAINVRPVLLCGVPEPSYPSSTTLLVLCVMSTAVMQLHGRIRSTVLRRCVVVSIVVFAAGVVAARLLSGVHWITDIVGGILLSGGLVTLYAAIGKTGEQ